MKTVEAQAKKWKGVVRRVKYHYAYNDETIFVSEDGELFYSRVAESKTQYTWYTNSGPDWFENENKVGENVLFAVIGEKGQVLFWEGNGTEISPWWEESSKLLLSIEVKYRMKYRLMSYEAYKKLMREYASEVDYKGYFENFMWVEKDEKYPQYSKREKLEEFAYGYWDSCFVERKSYKHKYMNKVISFYRVREDDSTILFIGVAFNDILDAAALDKE